MLKYFNLVVSHKIVTPLPLDPLGWIGLGLGLVLGLEWLSVCVCSASVLCVVSEEVPSKELPWRPSVEARELGPADRSWSSLDNNIAFLSLHFSSRRHIGTPGGWLWIRTSRQPPRLWRPRLTRLCLTRSWRRSMLCTNKPPQETSTLKSQDYWTSSKQNNVTSYGSVHWTSFHFIWISRGCAKWEAWNSKKGVSCEEAKQQYIEMVGTMKEKHGMA